MLYVLHYSRSLVDLRNGIAPNDMYARTISKTEYAPRFLVDICTAT